jgi:predicted DCC family thiol-disulfide oxidoreductase YuxK
VASGPPTWPVAAALLHLHVVEPDWIPPRHASAPDLLFFDGECGLCHIAVRFAIAEDARGTAFRFAPLQGTLFRETYPERERAAIGDSVAIRTCEGRTLTRSAAVLRILGGLGGMWRLAAMGGALLPARLLDSAYDLLAGVRRRLFSRPAQLCPAVGETLRTRFEE